MRKFIYILSLLFLSNQAFGQCYPDRHSTSWFDGWMSCETNESPNPAREAGHWIAYDFGSLYALNELKIWNVNAPDYLDNGAQNIIIDYSVDGINWFEYGEEKLPIAPGISTYEGDVITDLDGLVAQHVLITIVDNYGGECYGISEFRVAAEPVKDENEDICIIADVFPIPFDEALSITLKKKCLGDVYYALEDATGRTVMQEEVIAINDTKVVNTESLVAGVYFVCLRNGEIKERIKVVKY